MLAIGLLGGYALAQQVVDQGRPGKEGPWPITCVSGCSTTISTDAGISVTIGSLTVDGGNVMALTPHCSTIAQTTTLIGSSSTTVPASAQTGRIYIELTNSIENSAIDSTLVVKCTADGIAPTQGRGGHGDPAILGQTLHYDAYSTQTVKCIAYLLDGGSAVDAGVLGYECVAP